MDLRRLRLNSPCNQVLVLIVSSCASTICVGPGLFESCRSLGSMGTGRLSAIERFPNWLCNLLDGSSVPSLL